MTRASALLACLALSACAGGGNAAEEDGGAQGGEREACYPNGTCNEGLVCASNRCVKVDGAAGSTAAGGKGGAGAALAGKGGTSAGSSAGQPAAGGMSLAGAAGAAGAEAGAGGVAQGGSGGVGAAGASSTGGAGQAGAGGEASSGGAGSTGAAGATSCGFPKHLCAEVCVGNTPETGCFQSTSCSACPVPSNGSASCAADGQCTIACGGGFMRSGNQCVPTGAGGSGGSTGSPCTMCAGNCPTTQIDQFCAQQCFQMSCFMCELVDVPGQALPSCKCTCGG